MALTNNFLPKDGVDFNAVGHESIACNKLQDSDESPMALTDVDVSSAVPFDHVMDQDPTVADDQEPLDATSDMVLPTQQSFQCSENNYNSGMKRHSGTLPGRENPCLAEKDVSMGQLTSMVPTQVENEMEPSCCDVTDKVLPNLGNDRNMVRNVMSNPKQPAEQLRQLNVSLRNGTSPNFSILASLFKLRPSVSHEEQNMCCGDMEDKLGEDRYIDPKSIQQVAVGNGRFGYVFKACHTDSGTLFAIKKVTFTNGGKDEVMKEVHIMTGLCHPNIIKLLGSQVLGTKCWIFLEWMAGGSIRQLLSRCGPMSATVIQSYSEQVLSGIAYLHEREILHCDVKGANIVVDSTEQVAKLCDFGQAVKMPVPKGMKERGTDPFMAPEVYLLLLLLPFMALGVFPIGFTLVEQLQ